MKWTRRYIIESDSVELLYYDKSVFVQQTTIYKIYMCETRNYL